MFDEFYFFELNNDQGMSEKINVIIKAIDHNDWVMGEDLNISTFPDITLGILVKMIISRKDGMLRHHVNQMKFSLKSNTTDDKETLLDQIKFWDTSLKKCGIVNNTIITLRTSSKCFLWHPIEYYKEVFIQKVINVLESNKNEQEEKENIMSLDDDGGMNIATLKKLALPFPPPLQKLNFISFLRSYPDIFYIETCMNRENMTVWLNKDGSLPLWI